MMKAPRDRARIAASRVLKKNRPAAMPRAHPGRSLRNSRFATCSRSRPMIAAEEAMPISWIGDSLRRVRGFDPEARHEAGVQLGLVQVGEEPSDWKPMPSVGLGVNEIRVRIGGAFRVIYMAKFMEAVYVLHAFQKKSRKTARTDIELARRRFRELIQERRQR